MTHSGNGHFNGSTKTEYRVLEASDLDLMVREDEARTRWELLIRFKGVIEELKSERDAAQKRADEAEASVERLKTIINMMVRARWRLRAIRTCALVMSVVGTFIVRGASTLATNPLNFTVDNLQLFTAGMVLVVLSPILVWGSDESYPPQS